MMIDDDYPEYLQPLEFPFLPQKMIINKETKLTFTFHSKKS